jgi:putative photosynthetic complex assembly protein
MFVPDENRFPKAALMGAALLAMVSLGSVLAARMGLVGGPERPAATVAATPETSRDLRFFDREDGAVVVQPVNGGDPIVVAPGTGGFVRGVVRGLARDRKARGIGAEPAFSLTEWSNGKLTLEDTATGQRLDLNGFGPTNRAAFAAMLRTPGSDA